MFAWCCCITLHGTVKESGRDIPLVKEVDVLVVGGSSGAASAAISAAEAGARVFLAAPRTYLGDDLCGTLRLWLEEGETPQTPLAKKLFAAPTNEPAVFDGAINRPPDALDFTYTTSLPSVLPHKDSSPPSKLKDGLFERPESQSVQYNGDVEVVTDLGSVLPVKEARVVLFQGTDYSAASVAIQVSADKKQWQDLGKQTCPDSAQERTLVVKPLGLPTRYVRFQIQRAESSKRVLLGEIMLIGATATAKAEPTPPPPFPKTEVPKELARIAKPMQVKRVLDEALVEAKVDFLFGSYPTELLVDAQGKPCGIVMANRSGRQAVIAKVIIDATPRATVARMAGAQFQPYPVGDQVFYRTVVGGAPKSGPNLTARLLNETYRATGLKKGVYDAGVIEYTLRLPMRDGSYAAFAEAEQKARDLTWDSASLDASDSLFQVPPDAIKSAKAGTRPWTDVPSLELDAFRPSGSTRIFILGGCAEVAREVAAQLLRPLNLMDMGTRLGKVAAKEAQSLPAPTGPTVASSTAIKEAPGTSTFPGEVREFLGGLRPGQRKGTTVRSPDRTLPVLGMYDVVIVGGGTGGAPAGIGAGRGGAKALVIEYLHGLGGVGTLGMISTYYHGYRGGFTAEVDKGVAGLHATNRPARQSSWEIAPKVEWWRAANRKSGTEIWFGVLGCGAFIENGIVKGVIVATPEGRGVIIAKTVIDSTGNADVAAAAGAKCTYTDADDVGVQGTGLPPLELGASYTNTDYTFGDDTDVVDFWQLYILARQKFKNAYDLGQLVDTRERRRIVGDVTISPMDIILARTYPDALVLSKSNFDSHGFTVHPLFVAMPPDKKSLSLCVPMRALLPQGLDGILVTGLGVSAHRDAMPVIRMQPDIQNQGYACGYAAAMVASSASTIRQVDMKALQKYLAEVGIIPEEALSYKDSFPMPKERVEEAVANVTKSGDKDKELDGVVRNRDALAVIFAQPQDSIPMLVKAHASANGDDKLAYAHILAMLGNTAGAPTLVERIKNSAFDKGWNYKGMGQFGRSLSELDSYIVALGRTRHPQALEVVLEKARTLDATKEFSHHRACAMALETIGDRRAAPVLYQVLQQPGIMGHATPNIAEARRQVLPGGVEDKQRNAALREIVLARALYRCGDQDGLGEKILREYASDLRGHFARHAQAVLDLGKTAK